MTAVKHRQRGEIVGYILILILVLGLAYVGYWVVTTKPGKRFRGIEKIRGEVSGPVVDVAFRSERTALPYGPV